MFFSFCVYVYYSFLLFFVLQYVQCFFFFLGFEVFECMVLYFWLCILYSILYMLLYIVRVWYMIVGLFSFIVLDEGLLYLRLQMEVWFVKGLLCVVIII